MGLKPAELGHYQGNFQIYRFLDSLPGMSDISVLWWDLDIDLKQNYTLLRENRKHLHFMLFNLYFFFLSSMYYL